ncbi:unnamed protein product [Moneuplotes crassus]|uniref:Poly(A) RNA polymerase mitochondrial-like central palm domain-containing protein n=1 Tax=Euplotes crassus TaxID=5936 RepID=A0AAD1UJV7_EUPCR|nr:unnamed protein product [Moneuplotes crassus]
MATPEEKIILKIAKKFDLEDKLKSLKYTKIVEDRVFYSIKLRYFLLWILYTQNTKFKDFNRILKTINKEVEKLEEDNPGPSYGGILDRIKDITNLMPYLSQNGELLSFPEHTELFPDITDEYIENIYLEQLPDKETIEKVQSHLNVIQTLAKEWENECEIRPYGSISNGFLLKGSSDFDLTCVFSKKMKKHPYSYTKNLCDMLNSKYGDNMWNYILSPRLFLLNTTLPDNTEIEISFNNITGLLNSEYVRTLAEIDSRFHKLGYFIKYFVSSKNIFESTRKLNSFSLICMLIVFLQDQCDPPVLPRIIGKSSYLNKELRSPFYIKTMVGPSERHKFEYKAGEASLDPNFEFDHEEIKSFMDREVNQESVSVLFKRFIHFYFGGGGFDPIHDVVNTRTGRIEKIRKLNRVFEKRVLEKMEEACIAVIDPFDTSYCPSANFELRSCMTSRSMVGKMLQFIK